MDLYNLFSAAAYCSRQGFGELNHSKLRYDVLLRRIEPEHYVVTNNGDRKPLFTTKQLDEYVAWAAADGYFNR